MAYVDLNPVRAGMADDLQGSSHTSIYRRLQRPVDDRQPLNAVAGPIRPERLPISEAQYLRLVDWTGRQLHPGKRGLIEGTAPPVLPSVL